MVLHCEVLDTEKSASKFSTFNLRVMVQSLRFLSPLNSECANSSQKLCTVKVKLLKDLFFLHDLEHDIECKMLFALNNAIYRDRQERKGSEVALYARKCFDCIEINDGHDMVQCL